MHLGGLQALFYNLKSKGCASVHIFNNRIAGYRLSDQNIWVNLSSTGKNGDAVRQNYISQPSQCTPVLQHVYEFVQL